MGRATAFVLDEIEMKGPHARVNLVTYLHIQPRRIFRDTGERIERVTRIAFADDRQLRAFL